ncbi:MAG TPA: encapsulin-associated ferritin-like protein [Acidimicrobiia bacterium]
MAASSGALHEPGDQLRAETVERHRATVSLMEELEAIDWYDQRIDASSDEALRRVLAHNRDEEKEHAAMALEWLRRHDAALDGFLGAYLFSDGGIAERAEELEGEERGEGDGPGGASGDAGGSLGIGSLRAR